MFLIDRTKWWRFPHEDGGTTLVVSVEATEAQRWVVAYTILVTLIFMAACELATAVVLTMFKLGTSGTRHAMLVSYYNGARPSSNLPTMFRYSWNALSKCKKGGKWAVDWDTFWASFGLLLLALTLLSGDLVTKFFLSGRKLVVGHVAQADPSAVYYPAFDDNGVTANGNSVSPGIVQAFKALIPQAIYQANARATNAKERLDKRIQFSQKHLVDGALLPDGSHQNGTGAQYEYQYSLTGFEMGLRDAPQLNLTFRGTCATYHGSDGVLLRSVVSSFWPAKVEEVNRYPFYGDDGWSGVVPLSRENYTAPWANIVIKYDDVTQAQNELYGGYTFMIVPHTAWRLSMAPSPQPDPWYETEENPWYNQSSTIWDQKYRVKSARPAMRCTQNDTYTYGGKTVNHVSKLPELQGLKLSPFIRDIVFGREFGSPVFSKLLGSLPFGTLASTTFFDPNQRRLDVTRASLDDDFKGLVYTSFVYSREVVRNTVFLYSLLQGRNDTNFANAVDITGGPAKSADFFLESSAVSAMSVFVLVVTPSICVFLWILVYAWRKTFDLKSLDNKSRKGRYGLRLYGFHAVHLFRFLDEELSRKRKWSGRNTQTPYIRDLDGEQDDHDPGILPASVIAVPDTPSKEISITAIPQNRSQYAKPKVLPVQGPGQPPGRFQRVWAKVKTWIWGSHPKPEVGQHFDIAVTRVWDAEIPPVKFKHVKGDV